MAKIPFITANKQPRHFGCLKDLYDQNSDLDFDEPMEKSKSIPNNKDIKARSKRK